MPVPSGSLPARSATPCAEAGGATDRRRSRSWTCRSCGSPPAHQPLAAVYTVPWPGRVAVWRSPGEEGFELVTTLGRPARMGRLVADLYSGPTSRFDLGNVAIVDLAFGTLASVTDVALFGGANALAVEATPGVWEVLQFGVAELIAPGRYRLSRLLARSARHRGRHGNAGVCRRSHRGARRGAGAVAGLRSGTRA